MRTRKPVTVARSAIGAALMLGAFVLVPAQPAAAQVGAMIQPVSGRVTGVLSNRCGSTDSDHYGIDIAGNGGTAIGAAYAGTVTFAGYTSGGGNSVYLSHASGYVTKYLHMVQAPSVSVGQPVGRGQTLGFVGSTGNSTGPHLHFEVWRNGGLYSAIAGAYTCSGSVTKGAAINIDFAGLPVPVQVEDDHVSDFSGDGAADVLGVDASGVFWYYPHNGAGLSSPVRIGQGWGGFKHVMAADWSGDGAADVLGVDSGGYLRYYANNAQQLSPGVQIGQGWGGFKHVIAADFSADTKADVMAVDANGYLWYYPHSGTGFGTPVQVGQGWATFKHVSGADWNHDGRADIIGVDSGGYLWVYPYTASGFGTPVQIGHGWGAFKEVFAADWSGDGSADVLGVDDSGDLWYYPHNGSGLSTPVQIGNGWGAFTFVL
ncbi:hypothetical protein HDA40_002680 [Hamadaea flava]|uniref:Peptidoglycan DD-metalloendopeptidase family protein n=1 Tax=Hamadaea flava TaxID=1742688 RepID=A0ABV8LL57_9ACTN|nr:peptidoglycan DD-metalloendopeptidase family protein [Hamadaea flava]MCP2324173.1 hypothetical protein [Hamadaea flava]